MNQQVKMKRLLILLLTICMVFGASSFVANDMNVASFASEIVVKSNYEETYEAFDAAYKVNDATIVITKALFRDFTDENIYDLLSLTYSKEKWNEPVDQYTVYKLRILIVEKGNWINLYYKKTLIDPDAMVKEYKLEIIWPPYNGFENDIHDALPLSPGTIIDRFGYPGGRYLSPVATPYKERALVPGTKESKPYFQYIVLKEFLVVAGPIAPWFGVKGEGLQYFTPELTVQDYVDQGYLKKIEEQNR